MTIVATSLGDACFPIPSPWRPIGALAIVEAESPWPLYIDIFAIKSLRERR